MSNNLTPFPTSRYADHPLILQALAAVAAQERILAVRATPHVAARVHFPGVLSSLDQSKFFSHHAQDVTEEGYDAAMRILDKLGAELFSL